MRRARMAMNVWLVLAGALLFAVPVSAQQLQGQPGAPGAREFPASRVLPTPTPPFQGVITPNLIDSTPSWPATIARRCTARARSSPRCVRTSPATTSAASTGT